MIEDVFKFTFDKDHITGTKLQPLVYLEEAAGGYERKSLMMDINTLEYALVQRLLVRDCVPLVINIGCTNFDSRVTSNECITYLFDCYKHLILYQNNSNNNDDEDWASAVERIIRLIVRQAASALKQPNLYKKSQDIHSQVNAPNISLRRREHKL